MSIELTALAWQKALPTSQKIILLALCDAANQHGECWPRVRDIADKCCMGVRAVQFHLDQLETDGHIVRSPTAGSVTLYRVVG